MSWELPWRFFTQEELDHWSRAVQQQLEETEREHRMRQRRATLRCVLCPPHKNENAKRTYGRHGAQKARYKNRR